MKDQPTHRLQRMIASSATRLLGLAPATLLLPATPPPELSVQVVNQAGMPLCDAVIEAMPPAGDTRLPVFRWRNAMVQRDISFLPGSLIVPCEAVVAFPNLDKLRHTIYSFSKPRPLKIDLHGRDQTRTQQFKKAGTIALGCNIHD